MTTKKSEYMRRTRANARWAVLCHYGGDPPKCALCGFDNPLALVIDHIDGGGLAHRRSMGVAHISLWLRAKGFPEGFRILCHNCNALEAFRRGFIQQRQEGY